MKKSLIISGSCLAVVLLLFMTTDPNRVPSFMLIVPFLLLFASFLLVTSTLLQRQGMSSARSLRLGVVFVAIPLILLVLQSIGQLTVRDVLTVAILFSLSYFYVSRSAASS
jgi:uncharacterized membrane protein